MDSNFEYSIRKIDENDLDIVNSLWKNEDVRKYLGGIADDNRIRKSFESMVKSDNGNAYFVIQESGNKIGIASIDDYYIQGKKELSYQYMPEYWGKGIASLTIKEIIKYAKDKMKIVELYAETQYRNERSRKLLEKLQFIDIGKIERYGEIQSIYKIEL